MTAITFPLKKFPGQIKHEDIGFTGRISSLPILIVIALLFHLSLALMYNVHLLVLVLSFFPLLYIIVVFSVYTTKFQKRDSDYFGLSYKLLIETFRKDRRYFKKMFSVGLFLSIILWLISLQLYSIPLLSRLVVNSILLTTIISRTSIEGIYTQKNLFSMLSIMLLVEVIFWSITERYSFVDNVITPILFGFYYSTIKKIKSYQPIQLLQKIIS